MLRADQPQSGLRPRYLRSEAHPARPAPSRSGRVLSTASPRAADRAPGVRMRRGCAEAQRKPPLLPSSPSANAMRGTSWGGAAATAFSRFGRSQGGGRPSPEDLTARENEGSRLWWIGVAIGFWPFVLVAIVLGAISRCGGLR